MVLLPGLRAIGAATGRELYVAASQGDLTALEKLIAGKPDLNAADPLSGLTAWQASRMHGRDEASALLAKAGADTSRPIPPPAETLDRVMRANTQPNAPGLALLVARDGRIVFEKGYGLANIRDKRPVTPETIFRIGSVTKQFTATAILLCEEDGKLRTEDTLDKFFPGFPRGDKITLHHLLTHTSGIRSFTELPDFMLHVTESRTPEQMIARFRDAAPAFEPGTDWSYCNSGYFLLGEIAGQAAGRPYAELLRDRVFTPAGMTRTGVHRPGLNLPDEAQGYSRAGAGWEPAVDWHMSQAGGAGEIYSTVGDLFRWNEAIFTGKALRETSLKKAHTPVNMESKSPLGGMGKSYGYGWLITEKRGLKTISHNGGLDGFSSEILRFPEQKVTIVALANTMTPSGLMVPDEALNLAARLFLWEQMKPQPCVRDTPLPEGVKLGDYTGAFDFGGLGVMRFRDNKGKLQGKLAAQAWGDLRSSGTDRFGNEAVDATFEFQRDATGKVASVKLVQRGMTLAGKRFGEPKEGKMEPDKLAELAGTFDLGIGKFILRTKGAASGLAGHLGGQPELDFFPVDGAKDRFFSRAIRAELEFKRDAEGKVTDMILHQNGMALPGKKVAATGP
jgi:CubicO group peptidase (beta-lactamase class C family)